MIIIYLRFNTDLFCILNLETTKETAFILFIITDYYLDFELIIIIKGLHYRVENTLYLIFIILENHLKEFSYLNKINLEFDSPV